MSYSGFIESLLASMEISVQLDAETRISSVMGTDALSTSTQAPEGNSLSQPNSACNSPVRKNIVSEVLIKS